MKTQRYRAVSARANHRIELAGDWGDLPDFRERNGARMINMAIAIPDLIIEVHGSLIDNPIVKMTSQDGKASEVITDAAQLTQDAPTNPLFLGKAVINDLLNQSAQPHDLGAFLLERFGGGVEVVTNSTAPAGSGLGTSSILATALRSVLSHLWVGDSLSPEEACWQTFLMETALGLGSGWQDQIGGILPGIKDIVDDTSSQLTIQTVTLPPAFLDEMAALTVLAYTGRTRYSGDILNGVCEGLRHGRQTVEVVQALQEFCDPVRHALETGDYSALGDYANRITALEKQLHPGIVLPHVEQLFAETSPHCFGARICGAGGEGFLVFFTKGEKEKASMMQMLTNANLTCYSMLPGSGLTIDPRINETSTGTWS